MDTRLSPLIHWPERAELRSTMPECFQYSFGKRITVIIDCFEISFKNLLICWLEHKPSHLTSTITPLKSSLVSPFKAPSPLCPMLGVVEHLTSFLLKIVVSWTSWYLMTWSWKTGFTIHESVAFKRSELVIPAFTKGKNNLIP